jgi:integrase
MRKHGEISVEWRAAKNTWYFRVQVDGERVSKSTGVHLHSAAGKAAALVKAKAISLALATADEHKIAAVVKRPGFAKCGEVAEIYKVHGPKKSVTKSLSRFAAFVREVTGRQDWEEQSTHLVLTASALREWIEVQKKTKTKKKKKKNGIEGATRSESGIHTDVQTIKSIVARKRFYLFKDLKLPDLEEFWSVSGVAAQDQAYDPLGREVMRSMDRAARIPLRKTNPRVWAIYWLMRKAGLRNSEVENLEWKWVEFKEDKSVEIAMLRRENWKSKNGKYGRVPFDPRLMRLIRAALGDEGDFVIPRTSDADAYNLTHYDINKFVRRFIPDGSKGAYNLRKEFGSSIVMRDGIETAAKLLRDSIAVVEAHYFGLLNPPKPL